LDKDASDILHGIYVIFESYTTSAVDKHNKPKNQTIYAISNNVINIAKYLRHAI